MEHKNSNKIHWNFRSFFKNIIISINSSANKCIWTSPNHPNQIDILHIYLFVVRTSHQIFTIFTKCKNFRSKTWQLYCFFCPPLTVKRPNQAEDGGADAQQQICGRFAPKRCGNNFDGKRRENVRQQTVANDAECLEEGAEKQK